MRKEVSRCKRTWVFRRFFDSSDVKILEEPPAYWKSFAVQFPLYEDILRLEINMCAGHCPSSQIQPEMEKLKGIGDTRDSS
jgi:hypothetical protein